MSGHHIGVFISHSWDHSGHYEKLAEWIFAQDWEVESTPLILEDHSVPKENPIQNAPTDKALRAQIYRRIDRSHVVVIPTGMYSTHSKWIKEEIKGAKKLKTPILAVNPWAQIKKSSVVRENSDKCVGWRQASVMDGIWTLAQT